ncbi:hypothetical protein ACIQMJ_36495 [Actinosynnema sp. NPDC091369]
MRDATGPAETGGMDSVRIYDIMACNVYWDFDGSDLPREQHKFLVSFHPTDTPTPELVESIVATGPGGYRVEFADEPFTQRNLNGHIHDSALGFHWYMVNLPTGYLPEGEYTIEVTAKDGAVTRRSRVQRQESTDRIVPVYREHRARLLDSFTPSRTAEPRRGHPPGDAGAGEVLRLLRRDHRRQRAARRRPVRVPAAPVLHRARLTATPGDPVRRGRGWDQA